jgi:molybdate transport system substrate-binding protein
MLLTPTFRTLILVWLLLFTSSVSLANVETDEADKPLIIFAASSLTAPLQDIAKAYTVDTGQQISISFGSSSALARQLSLGAPSGVFISAHKKWITWLQKNSKNVEQTPATSIAQNGLVLAARKDIAERLALTRDQSWDDYLTALGSNRLIIGEPTTVPLGQYAKRYLQYNDLWGRLKDKLAPARDALGATMLLKSGQSPLAILFQSDVTTHDNLMVLKYLYWSPTSPIHYYVLPIKKPQDNERAQDNEKAQQFIDYLSEDKASKLFCNHGLTAHTCANIAQP